MLISLTLNHATPSKEQECLNRASDKCHRMLLPKISEGDFAAAYLQRSLLGIKRFMSIS